MSTKQSNIEAVRIYRPLTCGQVRDTLDAWTTAVVDILMGVNLLPPHSSKFLYFHK